MKWEYWDQLKKTLPLGWMMKGKLASKRNYNMKCKKLENGSVR